MFVAVLYLPFSLFILFLDSILCCDKGLTQLRHRTSLTIMKCVPTLQGQPDPCIVQTGGRMAFCQNDGNDFVCCGTTQLLVELIAPQGQNMHPRSTYESYDQSSRERPFHDYSVVIRSPPNMMNEHYQMTEGILPPIVFHKNPFPTKSSIKLATSKLIRSPISLSLLTQPTISTAGPNSWTIKPTVFLLQDGACNVLVNTGLPAQGPEVVEALTSRGVTEARYTVATSPHIQYTGNLNLFPKSQVIVGRWHSREKHVTRWNTGKGYRMDLCSPSLYTIPTPGPSEDAITVIATNVPAMGTVAIVGSLFTESGSLEQMSPLWVSSTTSTLQSRRIVVCSVDWIFPAFGMPFPVTNTMRQAAGCNKHSI